jgi:hypothetical protein
MDRDTLAFYISYISSKSLITSQKLLEWRAINKDWKTAIEQEAVDVKHILQLQSRIHKILYYDPEIYDKYTYRRNMLKREINVMYDKYHELTIPTIGWCVEDLDLDSDEPEKVYYVDSQGLPSEYYILLSEYAKSPSILVRLYAPEMLEQLSKSQTNFVRGTSAAVSGQFQASKLILLHPIAYTKHYRTSLKDKQYVAVVCYVNLLDEDLNNDFPDEMERYLVLTVDLQDLDDKEEHYKKVSEMCLKITRSLITNNPKEKISEYIYPQNIAEDCQPLDRCLETILEHQKFNL